MLNFTVGPVQSNEIVREIGYEQVPYFRTTEFSRIVLESEALLKKFAKAPKKAKAVFMTGSGTLSMEAAVINTLTKEDKLLVVNGGTFGQRFVDICRIHKLDFDEVKMELGCDITAEALQPFENKGYTAFLVNVHETSTGVRYNIELISEFCKRNGMLLIVDAISSFLADAFDMAELAADVMITGSQKALACPPGISMLVLSERALERVNSGDPESLYLDLKPALRDAERGQTPFTPAVSVIRQIHARLTEMEAAGGVDAEIARVFALARDFRERIKELPFAVVSKALSNAVTPLHPLHSSAFDIFTVLKDEYAIWVCPNGGEMKEKIFRVGHIGAVTTEDNSILIDAFFDLRKRGILR